MSIGSTLVALNGFFFILTSATYDLIDPTPRCYTLGICTEYGVWGTYTAAHPNSEEKTQRTLINLARMYPDDYITSAYGKYQYGKYGPATVYDTGGYCGQAADIPYYWMSDANQASRWGEWDCLNCDGSCGHSTCSNPDRCSEFFGGDCGFGTRCDAFVNQYGSSCSGEGLCGANMCYTDGHCSAMFNPDSSIFGVGFSPGANGITLSYINPGSYSVDYSIANVAHFDERIKINGADYDSNGNYLSFMLQWFDNSRNAQNVYVVYQGNYYSMDLAFGNNQNGFYKLNQAIPDQCEPYYFIVQTTSDEYFRMPESDDYMFGTAWSNWSWWKPDGTGGTPNACNENHYYLTNNKWVPNGGPNTGVSSDSNCKGCSNTYSIADIWDTLSGGGSTGTGDDDDDTGDDDDNTYTDEPTPEPTPQPASDPSKFYCNDGCGIPTSYHLDGNYCDCSDCEDETKYTCDTCGNKDGKTCENTIKDNCGSWIRCDGVTPAPTDGGNETPKPTSRPTNNPVDCPSDKWCCPDGCQIKSSYYNDGWCDCSDCEDELDYSCSSCRGDDDDCDYMQTCGNYIKCTASNIDTNGNSGGRTDGDDGDNSDDGDTRDGSSGSSSSGSGNKNNNNNGIGDVELILIIVGCVAALIVVGIGFYFGCKKWKNRKQDGDGLLEKDYIAPQVALTEGGGVDKENETDTRVY